ncbi:hypothetical protein I3842_13G027700 [Carya illinoinensis]|uniref:K Homology domain-containing protein n=1 Tax=Carya illinoinensis TaxID=32201 RepID=A0A922AEH6_CARIL|nr:hypothetical protein I3842_13G027700 [Carya illinoinensis]
MMHPSVPVPVPVPIPVNLPIPESGTGQSSVGKRRREDDLFSSAIVVPSRQIGKEGFRIQKICEDSKATIKIADAIARHEERVIIISSKDSDGTASDAENALQQIASLILQEDDSITETKVAAGHVVSNTIRLLIAGNSCGATIMVLAQNQLPLCAPAHESDRVVPVQCDGPAVLKALEEIGSQLSPSYNYTSIRPPQQYPDPTSADYVTFEMVISETLVGGLISRCVSNISRIRIESGAMIKVYGGKVEQKHRQIQFGGSTQQVALTKQRVDEYIYSQLIQQASAQQQV